MKAKTNQQITVRALAVFLSLLFVLYAWPITVNAVTLSADLEESSTISADDTTSAVEVVAFREENAKHFRLSDGSYIAAVYNTPVHYKDEEGVWQDINNTLVMDEDGRYAITAGGYDLSFSESVGDGALLSLSTDQYSFSFTPTGLFAAASATVENPEQSDYEDASYATLSRLSNISSVIRYENAAPGVTLEYRIIGNSIYENIIIENAEAPSDYSFHLTMSGLLPIERADGAIALCDKESGAEVFTLPSSFMFDHSLEANATASLVNQNATSGLQSAEGGYSSDVSYTLVPVSSSEAEETYLLTISANSDWLEEADRIYPVTVDPPTLPVNGFNFVDTYVTSRYPTEVFGSNVNISVSEHNGYDVYSEAYTYVKALSFPDLPVGAVVGGAYLSLLVVPGTIELSGGTGSSFRIAAHMLLDDFNTATSWSNKPAHSAELIDYATVSEETQFVSFNVTSAYEKWMNGTDNHGVCIKLYDCPAEGNSHQIVFYSTDNNSTGIIPQMEFYYLMATGLEDLYTYTPVETLIGTAYIGDAAGSLTLLAPTVSAENALWNYSPTLVYRSQAAGASTVASFDNGQRTVPAIVGSGWMFDFQEHVYVTWDGETVENYIWLDSDGTEHWFYPNDQGVFTDETGLGITLSLNDGSSQIILSFRDGSKHFFGVANGRLLSRADSVGNKLVFTYSGDRVSAITLQPASYTSSVSLYTLQYNNAGLLSKIVSVPTAAYAKVSLSAENGVMLLQSLYTDAPSVYGETYDTLLFAQLLYDESARLCEVRDIDAAPFRATQFNYDAHSRVSSVEDVLVSGSMTAYDAETTLLSIAYQGKETVYRFPGKDDIHGTNDDLLTVCTFDTFARTVHCYTTNLSRSLLYGSSATTYAGDANALVSSSVQSAAMPHNLLTGGTFETGTTLTAAGWSGDAAYATTASYDVFRPTTRARYLKISLTAEADASHASVFKTPLLDAGDYNFSVYIDTSDIGTGEAYLTVSNAAGTVLAISERATASFAAFGQGDGYLLSLPFTAETSGNYKLSLHLSRSDTAATAVRADNASLVRGHGIGSFDYMQNGQLNGATYWSGAGQYSAVGGMLGGAAIRIDGDISERKVHSQSVFTYNASLVPPPLTAGEAQSFLLTGFAKADALRDHDNAEFSLGATASYYNTVTRTSLSVTYTASFNAGVLGWQMASVPIRLTAEKANVSATQFVAENYVLRSLTVDCTYGYNINTAYFDNISLVYDSTHTLAYEYEDGKTTSITLPDGKTVTYVYEDEDSPHEPSRVTAVDGSIYEFSYNAKRQITRAVYTSSDGGIVTTTDYTYDAAGNVTSTETAAAGLSEVLYSHASYATSGPSIGALLSTTDYLGNITLYHRDYTNGRLLAEEYPDGTGVFYLYDSRGRLEAMIPCANEADWSLVFDQSIYDTTEGVAYAYDANGQLTTIWTPSSTYTFTYDSYGNTTSVALNGQTLATYTYTGTHGKLMTTTHGNGHAIHYVYDALDRIVGIRYNEDEAARYTYVYNAEGLLSLHTDARQGLNYAYTYDVKGRVSSALVSKTDAVPVYRLVYDYDGMDRVVQTSYTVYTTDANGALVTSTLTFVPTYNADGIVTAYTYKKQGEAFATTHYNYDAFGRLASRSTADGELAVSKNYTFQNRTVGNKTYTGTQVKAYTASAFLGGLPKYIYTWGYTYNKNGNITKIVEYDGAKPVREQRFEYDAKGQLSAEHNTDLSNSDVTVTDTCYYQYVYSNANAGNIQIVSRQRTTVSADGEETVEYFGGHTFFYGGDTFLDNTNAKGDWLSGWGFGDAITHIPDYTFTHDGIYNPLQYVSPSGKSFTFTWEGRRLVGANGNISYTYNADGIRTGKTVDGVEHTFILNGATVLADVWTENGTNYAIYYTYDETGLPFSMEYTDGTNSVLLYYITNLSGDVVALCTPEGDIAATYSYSAWGHTSVSLNASAAPVVQTAADLNPFRYRSYYYDAETEFYYCNSRYYDPQIYRWLNADTADVLAIAPYEISDKNLFAYCDNNPVMRADGDGKFWNIIAGAVVGATVSFVSSVVTDLIFNDGDVNWAKAGASAAIGALTGAAMAAFPGAAVAISAASGVVDSVVGDVLDNHDDNPDNDVSVSEMIVNATTSAAMGVVSGSWGSEFATNDLHASAQVARRVLKQSGLNPAVKKALKQTVAKANRAIWAAVLPSLGEGMAMAAIQGGTKFAMNKAVAYLKIRE